MYGAQYAMVVWVFACAALSQAESGVTTRPADQHERRLLPPRQFDSKLEFEVYAVLEEGHGDIEIGQTPARIPLEIPACARWWVRPTGSLNRSKGVMEVVRPEIEAQGIPGLLLPADTPDEELAQLRGIKGLRMLDVRYAKIKKAGWATIATLQDLEVIGLRDKLLTKTCAKQLEKLPALHAIDFKKHSHVTAAKLERLRKLKGLRGLHIGNCDLTDEGTIVLGKFKELRWLDLNRTQITDVGLESLGRISTLESLDLRGTRITGKGLEALRNMKNLRSLRFWHANLEGGIEHLAAMKSLQSLELQATDAQLLLLTKELTGLRELEIEGGSITDAGLAHLGELKQLQILTLPAGKITDAALEQIGKLRNMRELGLGWCGITDAGMSHLRNLKQMRTFTLIGAKITGAGLMHLRELRELEDLNLCYTDVTDAGLQDLRELQGLRRLLLANTKVTDAGLTYLKELKNLRELVLTDTAVTRDGMARLRESLPNCQLGWMRPVQGD